MTEVDSGGWFYRKDRASQEDRPADPAYFDDVFFHRAISVHMVQMAIVQIIDMITMLDTSVFAVGTVDVGVVNVGGAGAHGCLLSLACSTASSAMWVT